MRRRTVLAGLASGVLSAAALRAQPSRKSTVGFAGSEVPLFQAFVAGLREFGWRPGENVEIIHGGPRATLDVIDQLLEQKVDVLVAPGALRLQHAAQLGKATPLVGVDLESDPVASGFVQSLARPGGNMTGVWLDMPEMAGKLVELLKEVVPQIASVAVLWDARVGQPQGEATKKAAGTAGILVHQLPFSEGSSIEQDVASIPGDALIVLTSPPIYFERARIARAAAARRMPSISVFPDFARAGGLIGYGPSLSGMFRSVARHVHQVLRGRSPAEIPVERPAIFELVLNRRTADELGISLPALVLARATEVIE